MILASLGVVANSRYLMLVAALVLVLSWVISTGEYIIAEKIVRNALEQVANYSMLDKVRLIVNILRNIFQSLMLCHYLFK